MKNLYFSFAAVLAATVLHAQTFTCGDTLIDVRDGQTYTTVLVGSDCWFSQNLNYGTFVQSDSLSIIHSQQTNNSIAEKYAQLNDTANLPIYGGLYEQSELMNFSSSPQGLCPSGWHVSTDAEWQSLITNSGGAMLTANAGHGGNALKKVGEGFGAGAGTDAVGFSAKHGGDRDGFGIFYGMGYRAIFWTSTAAGPGQAYHYTLWADNDTIERLALGVITTGFSCRCVKDAANSVNEQSQSPSFRVFPNPASENVTVSELPAEGKITVTDIIGRVVYEQNISGNSVQLVTTEWSPGWYTISVVDAASGNIHTEKLIINEN